MVSAEEEGVHPSVEAERVDIRKQAIEEVAANARRLVFVESIATHQVATRSR